MPSDEQRFSIKETSRLSGLPASTLRYYETIGVIEPVDRGESSGHRTYDQDDLDRIDTIASLSATGMSIPDMREYLEHRLKGAAGAHQEIALLSKQQLHLEDEQRKLALRQEYVSQKIQYWQAIEKGDSEKAARAAAAAQSAGQSARQKQNF